MMSLLLSGRIAITSLIRLLPYLRRAIQNASISYLRSSYFNEKQMTEQMEEIWAFLENHILSSDNPLQALELANEYHHHEEGGGIASQMPCHI